MTRLAGTALLALALACGCSAQDTPKPEGGKEPDRRPSVIFFIGDGMGLSQLTLGRVGSQELKRPYHFDRFTTIGLASTRSANWVVTDSAAAATALASGIKTNNQTVGMSVDGKPVQTILEAAHAEGYATGLVTTTRITHATPACFVAHVSERDDEGPIAEQLLACATTQGYPEVFIGGGRRYFKEPARAELEKAGYAVVTDPMALGAAKGTKLAGLLADSHYPFAIERPQGAPDLAALTAKAVELLAATGKPFFLMVEGGRIDHAAHQHDAPACLRDQLDLDGAIGWALDRVAADPKKLLVLCTADHATGDLGISETVKLDGLLAVKASTDGMVKDKLDPRDAGAMADFVGTVKAATGLELTPEELALIWREPPNSYWARTALGHVVSARLGVHFYDPVMQEREHTNTHGHDGAMVGVYASGVGHERFGGIYENNIIPQKIAELMGFRLRDAVPAPGQPASALPPAGAPR